jgi:hypothetical protein
MAGHAAMVLLFALNLELTPVLLNAPLLGYHGYLYDIPFHPFLILRAFCVWQSFVAHKFEKSVSFFRARAHLCMEDLSKNQKCAG